MCPTICRPGYSSQFVPWAAFWHSARTFDKVRLRLRAFDRQPRRRCRVKPTTKNPSCQFCVNPFFFWGGGQIFSVTGTLARTKNPEVGRAESGDGVLGEGSDCPSPPARGTGERCKLLGERCKLPQRGPGGAPENLKFGATWDLKVTTEMRYNV